MAMQINDIEIDLLQTEDGNTSDITINYSSDASSIGTIIYDHNLHNDCDKSILHGEKNCQRSTYYNNSYSIILILFDISCNKYYSNYETYFI